MEELHTGHYDGVNYVIADSESGWVVHGGNEIEAVELREGLSIVGSRDVNDPTAGCNASSTPMAFIF